MAEKRLHGQTGQRANGQTNPPIDVLCVGHAAYDLTFSVSHQPGADQKISATALSECGGGPAANAAVTASRLGLRSAFAGYLGNDVFGDRHLMELEKKGVHTGLVVRGNASTPLSIILVKPDGERSLVNYRENTNPIPAETISLEAYRPKVILFDGHEPFMAGKLVKHARAKDIPTILDAGSVHPGTETLASQVDYLIASSTFARNYTGHHDPVAALAEMRDLAPCIVITLGADGLIWRRHRDSGSMPAVPVSAVDTTGAGDAFHGAFAAGLSRQLDWRDLLDLSNTVAALCCVKIGSRHGIPTRSEVADFLASQDKKLRL